ncbi:MAG: prepilin-type N-terminal cleavage/methylation domain-containing protein [Candidatus Omnitrophota bacterium]
MKKAFTLLEIMVVLVIIGILAMLSFTQFARVMERGRTAEGKANLGTLRTLTIALNQTNGALPNVASLETASGLPFGTTNACVATAGENTQKEHYYNYDIDATGTLTAHRCSVNGKPPQAAGGSIHDLTLTYNGTGSSSPTGWW